MKIILYNAKVYVEKGHFADAIRIEDGYIRAVGANDEIKPYADAQTRRIDCQGRTLIPGLNDSHLHFMQYAEICRQAPIEHAASIDEMVSICREFIAKYPDRTAAGLHASGWNQDLFTDGGKRLPDRFDLDKISTNIPVVLERVCGHIVSVNTKAIEILGIDASSPQYPNGEFRIGEDGFPSGIFTGNACAFAKTAVPDLTFAERRETLLDAMQYAVSRGITSIQSNDAGAVPMKPDAVFALLEDIYDKGDAPLRYRHQICCDTPEDFHDCLAKGRFSTASHDSSVWLTAGPLKLFKDGSLGARTALMKNGYRNDPDNYGLEWLTAEEMERFCRLAADHGVQIITHAIGDAAIENVITCYEKTFTDSKNKLRHGLVHCQITDNALVDRIVDQDILVFAQPVFLDYDMKIVENLCGKSLASASYAFGDLYRRGVHLSYGTDCPVEDCNPFPNLYMAVTRKDFTGNPPDGFYSSQCVSVEDAVDAYTYESAYAEFMEDRKGRIKPGFYADLILLDRDIFTIDPMEIKDISPLMTMTGGKIVYTTPAFSQMT